MWIDDDFPRILGAELLRPDAQFIAKFVCQPQVVWDASATRGKSVQLDRYEYWEDDSRAMSPHSLMAIIIASPLPDSLNTYGKMPISAQ